METSNPEKLISPTLRLNSNQLRFRSFLDEEIKNINKAPLDNLAMKESYHKKNDVIGKLFIKDFYNTASILNDTNTCPTEANIKIYIERSTSESERKIDTPPLIIH